MVRDCVNNRIQMKKRSLYLIAAVVGASFAGAYPFIYRAVPLGRCYGYEIATAFAALAIYAGVRALIANAKSHISGWPGLLHYLIGAVATSLGVYGVLNYWLFRVLRVDIFTPRIIIFVVLAAALLIAVWIFGKRASRATQAGTGGSMTKHQLIKAVIWCLLAGIIAFALAIVTGNLQVYVATPTRGLITNQTEEDECIEGGGVIMEALGHPSPSCFLKMNYPAHTRECVRF